MTEIPMNLLNHVRKSPLQSFTCHGVPVVLAYPTVEVARSTLTSICILTAPFCHHLLHEIQQCMVTQKLPSHALAPFKAGNHQHALLAVFVSKR